MTIKLKTMKKKIIGVAVMAAIAVTAGWNMSQKANDVKLSDLALSNVEALAQSEGGSYTECYLYGCRFAYNYYCTIYKYGSYVTTCTDYRG